MKKKSSEISKSKRRSFWKSVNNALEGVIHTFQSERNMRIHFLAAFFVLIVGVYFDLHYMELIILLFAISFVLVAEMINTAVEYISDLVSDKKFNPVIKLIKDISAGAVFVSAVNAALTGYILTVNRASLHRGRLFIKITQSNWHMTFIALLFCVAAVIMIKVMRKEDNLLKGGMPSGHSALAFSIWMATWIISKNSLISIMVFLLAIIVARSRVLTGIHSAWEVFAGSVLGALTTLLVFQVMS